MKVWIIKPMVLGKLAKYLEKDHHSKIQIQGTYSSSDMTINLGPYNLEKNVKGY